MSRAVAVSVPAHVRGLTGLDRVDYQDAFTVRTPVQKTAQEWATLILESAPPAVRGVVRWAHRILGLRLAAAGSPGHAWGWEISPAGPEAVLLSVEGRIITPRIVISTAPGHFVGSTLVRYDHASARAVWAVISPMHRAVARYLLGHAATVSTVSDRRAAAGR